MDIRLPTIITIRGGGKMTKEEKAINGLKFLRDTVESDEDFEMFDIAIKALEQKSRKGHWINKHHSDEDESCSAECSSCHKRSDGYAFEYGYGLKFKYYDFCPMCGSDNRGR